MIVRMVEQFGTHLQGKPLGKRHFALMCGLLSDAPAGMVVYLDFTGVDILTGSWANAMFVPFIKWAVEEQIDLFPVVCNLQSKWVEELELVAEWNYRCFLVADGPVSPKKAAAVGPLDPGQRETLLAVLAAGRATGAELERRGTIPGVKATALNNRLRDLYEKRLLRREKKGREQIYFPVVEEITLDGRQLPETAGPQLPQGSGPGDD